MTKSMENVLYSVLFVRGAYFVLWYWGFPAEQAVVPVVHRETPFPPWPTLWKSACFGDILLTDKFPIELWSFYLGGVEISFGRWELWSWEGDLGWDSVCRGTRGRADGQRASRRLCAQQICCRALLRLALGRWLLSWVGCIATSLTGELKVHLTEVKSSPKRLEVLYLCLRLCNNSQITLWAD